MLIQKRACQGVAVALLVGVVIPACGSSSTQPPPCTPTYLYSNVKAQGSALFVINIQADPNYTGKVETDVFHDDYTGSFAIEDSTTHVTTVSANINASSQFTNVDGEFAAMPALQAGAAFSKVYQTDHAVTSTTTLSVGSDVYVYNVPAGATAYGLFGVVVKVTNGDLRSTNCPSLQQDTHETVILPEETEWCTWVRGPDEFTDGGKSPCVVVADELTS